MTTIADYLNDLVADIEKKYGELLDDELTPEEYNDVREDLINDTLQIIKERIVGEIWPTLKM